MWAVACTPSDRDCHFEDYAKSISDDWHMDLSVLISSIIIIFKHNSDKTLWWRESFGHSYCPSLMISILWVVFIDYIILPIRRGWFFYLWIEVKELLFDSGYVSPDFSNTKKFIGLLAIFITPNCMFFNANNIYSPTMSFDNHICCCFIFFNFWYYFIDQRSQREMFLSRQVLVLWLVWSNLW